MNEISLKNLSVLIVDDEPDVNLGIKYLVASLGCDVKTASSGEMAIAILEKGFFDLVLSDISMPGMKGNDLLKIIKEKWPLTEIILITGFGTLELAEICLNAGASHFIAKPFENKELINIVTVVGQKILTERNSKV